MTGSAPLAGLRVLDLTLGPAGGIATMVLADFGAEVLKVEPPSGDPYRRLAAAPMWLRGKQSLILDLHDQVAQERLHSLVDGADVAVVGLRPATAARLSIDAATLRSLNPRLIYCGITGFGDRGPYRDYKGYEGIVAAKSGRMVSFAGQQQREGPAYAAVQVATHATAQAAVQGVLAALIVRAQTGTGQTVSTSLLQGMLPYDMAGLATRQLMQKFPEQFPADPLAGYNRQPTLQYQPVLTADGQWLQLGNLIEHLFHAFINAAGLSHIYADERFTNAPYLTDENREALRAIMIERMQERTADEWMAAFIADGNVAAEPVVSAQRALHHPQMRHNGDVLDRDTRRHGAVRQLGPVAALRATPAVVAGDVPDIDDHTLDLAERWRNGGTPDTGSAAEGSRPNHGPLAGVTVVELATIIAAPLSCALLGDLGARVIKIEAPPAGDPLRNLGNGVSAAKTTASKESICIDLKRPEGQAIARALIANADVLVHNFRPGVAERLGFGYDDVQAFNPRIVYVSAMGYGVDGPYAHRPSAHPIAGAASGGALWQAGGSWPPPTGTTEEIKEAARAFTRANEVNPDPSTSMAIATAALLGLYAQRIHGVGQRVDTNMFVANAYANADDFLSYEGKPPRPRVDAGLFGLSPLYRLYPTADGWVFLACLTDAEWSAFCHAAGHPELSDDPRFATSDLRSRHHDDLARSIEALFSERPSEEWESILTAADVACVRASGAAPGEFWDTDPHVRDNGFVAEVEHPLWGRMRRHGPLLIFSETPATPGPGTVAGQHTSAILRELGYDEETVARLRAEGTIASAAE
ncbi:MAG: CaiB/BaiF CoA transferase family protein [Dehalococcoidia bacterium]